MPWMLQPHNYTQMLKPNIYNVAYRRVGTYKGMGLITSSNFFVPQVNQPGSMASFVLPAAVPVAVAPVPNANGTRGLGAVHRYWRIGRGGLGQGDALAQAQDAARANYAHTVRYVPATRQMLLSRRMAGALRGLGQQVGPLYTCPTGDQVFRTSDCPGGQPVPDVQQQIADIWSQITSGTTQPSAPSATLTQWLPWIAIGALGLIVIARR